jgi:hypothetical protein
MIAFTLPRTLLVVGLVVPVLGWRVAGAHARVVAVVLILLIEIIALTVERVPFTRPYRPGHARLKSRWMVYLGGVYLFAYIPARMMLRSGLSVPLFEMVGLVPLELIGRRRVEFPAEESYPELEIAVVSDMTVLDLPPGSLPAGGNHKLV